MYVKSVHFEQIKAFSDATFEFGSAGRFAGWNVFVGGNSSGKSTILKGIALAVAGPDEGRRLIRTPAGWLRHDTEKGVVVTEIEWDSKHDRFRQGGALPGARFEAGLRWVRKATKEETAVSLLPIDLRNARKSRVKTAERGPWEASAGGWFCAGYGPMRRLTGSSSDAVRDAVGGGVVSRLVTLFREDAALTESEEWLKKLHSRVLESGNGKGSSHQILLDDIVAFLNAGLLPNDSRITRVTVDHVWLAGPDGLELPMRDLSDGYRSVYALLLDLIHSFYEVYGAEGLFREREDGIRYVDRPGVVLIDEVEAHLHPAWQQILPEWLKTRFPKVQFIVTTHSPLIAQAADPGGIYVLPLQNEKNRAPRRLDSHEFEKIKLGRAEKILLGTAFGLSNTRSAWANQQIKRWKTLNAKRRATALTPQEQKEYESLKPQMEFAFDSFEQGE